MQFILTNQDIINHLNTIDKNEHNNFINYLLTLGYTEYNKSNKINNTILDNNLIELENKLDNKFDNLKLLINEIKLENQNNLLVLNKNNNKGNIGESLIYDFFNKNKYQIEDTSEIAHSGDLKLYLSEINQNVLIEIKNYKNTVDQKQIDKFYYDLDYTGINLGIFISLQSKIVNTKYPIEWKITEKNKIMIFISGNSEEYLYIAIFCLITLYKNNNNTNLNFKHINNEDLFNDIKYLSLQKESINKLKNEILNIHSSSSSSILSLYNNLCIFDNNFNYILNKIYNKLDLMINKIGSLDNNIYINLENIQNNNKDFLEIIISDLSTNYYLNLIDNKKIQINNKSDIQIGEIKILKTSINLILKSGLEIKNINQDNWNKIIELL